MADLSLDQSTYMTTYSGVRFTLFDPQPEQILIEDIAHALSMLCRFTGHTTEFYSVAQHSVLVSWNLPRPLQFQGLMHDAAEAYINDLSRPLKHHPDMGAYRRAEFKLEHAIRLKFGIPLVLSTDVKRIDDLIVVDEAKRLWRHQPEWTTRHPSLGMSINPWTPKQAKEAFLAQFDSCMRDITQARIAG